MPLLGRLVQDIVYGGEISQHGFAVIDHSQNQIHSKENVALFIKLRLINPSPERPTNVV